jgi:hypothetical protein
MGKKRIKKYKINSSVKKENSESSSVNNDDNKNEENKKIQIKIDLKFILDIINNSNPLEIIKLSSFLNTYNYDLLIQEQDKREKEIFVLTSNDFLIPYLNILIILKSKDEDMKKIKYNIISSIINIFSSFSDKINLRYIYNKVLSEIFNQCFLNYSKEFNNNNIIDNTNYKILLLIFDLFQLFIDIMKEEENINSKSGLINYDNIISLIIKEYIFNNNIDKEIKNKSELLLFSLFSNFYIEINDKNDIKLLLNNVFGNSDIVEITPFLYFVSFYILIINGDLNSLNLIIQKIIDFSKDINIFNNEINDFTCFINEFFNLEEKQESINEINSINSDAETKRKLNSFLFNCHTIYSLFKIYNDIIENLNDEFSADDIYLTNISVNINKLFNKSNISILNQLFNDNFISSLIKLMNNLIQNNIESAFMDNNDSILRIKENLNDMLLLILGIINNIILKLNKKIKKDDISILMNIIYIRLNNYKSNNDEEIYLIILLLRNMLEKKLINIETILIENNKNEELNPLDYKLLFSIFNYFLNDDYIKINIIDIISLIYSTEITNDKSWYEVIQEINNLLMTLLYNEKNIEISSHVINAFMDIYQWDDIILNKILKNSNVLNIMSNGLKTFKQKMENLYKTNELTEDAYSYVSETLTNMKRFIKYKKEN